MLTANPFENIKPLTSEVLIPQFCALYKKVKDNLSRNLLESDNPQ